MSIHPFHNSVQNPPSCQISQCTRPPNKLSTFFVQNNLQQNELKNEKIVRNNSRQKHKTFATVDSNNKPQFKLSNNDQRKVLLLLGLAQQFIQNYQNKKFSHQQSLRQKRTDRKKILNLQSQSQFKIIQPKNNINHQQQEAYNFFLNIRSSIKDSYRQKFLSQIKKSTEKFDQIIPKEEQSNNMNHIQKSRSSQNVSQNYNTKTLPSTFITCDFNHTSMSGSFPQIDMMNVSNFPQGMSQILRQQKCPDKQKFHHLKLKSQRTRLRIHPVVNRFESRKKQEIRTFMQLNQKTQHLQNFRSQQGKFFKFNENLKLTVKNINLCRVVLLSKKNALIQQLDRLGDDLYFRQQNKKIKEIRNNEYNTSYSKQSNRSSSNDKPKQSQSISQTITFSPFKQKAIRIISYFEQTVRYFSQIESFLLEFIKKDKSYQNYLHQNQIKVKLKANLKFTQKEKFYDDFVDQCFHMSQISRIYFNVLNQLTHFNLSINEFKIINKENLQRQTKRLIQLRYVIIYLQKQCENTSQSPYLIDYNYQPKDIANNNNDLSNTIYSQQSTCRQGSSQQSRKMNSTVRASSNMSSILKQFANMQSVDQIKQSTMNKRSSKAYMSQPVIKPMQKLASSLNRVPSEIIRRSIQKRKIAQQISNNAKQQNLDMNQIWKTFYNKKFSSNAMRLRLY